LAQEVVAKQDSAQISINANNWLCLLCSKIN
jgi:hypothetical protein